MLKLQEFRTYNSDNQLLLENIQDNEWIDADVFFDLLEKEVETWCE